MGIDQERPVAGDRAALWVLGTYSMTGSHAGRHAAETVASAAGAGHGLLTLSFHPGAFAEGDIAGELARRAAPGAMGVVYLRSLTRLAGGGDRLRAWRARWRALRCLVGRSPRVILLRETRATGGRTARLQWLLGRALCFGNRHVRMHSLERPPVDILQQDLGLPAAAVAPQEAEDRVIAHIRARSTIDLRITDAHVARALAHPASATLPATVREDLAALALSARRLSSRDIDSALRHGLDRQTGAAPRAIAAALGPSARDPAVPRYAEHLRLIGKPRRHWMRFLPPDRPGHWRDRGHQGVVLRRLAGLGRPEDVAELEALDWPLCPGHSPLTRYEWFLILAMRLPLTSLASLRAPWACPILHQRLREELSGSPAALPGAVRPRGGGPAAAPGFRLTGIAANGSGLAQNFWMSAQALGRAGIQTDLAPLDTTERPAAPLAHVARPPSDLVLTRNVTLFHVNADRIPQELLADARARDPFSIGYLLWELDRLPAAHELALDMLDEVWVPSVFLKRLYQKRFPGKVSLMRKAIDLPPPAPMPGPPPGVRRIVMAFDQRSSVARKNPMAAVRAFQRAFVGRRDVELLIKTTPEGGADWSAAGGQLAALGAAATRDRRIRVLRAYLPMPQFLGLIAGANAIVSPHRAEGFGYIPAFALALGVPVVVTDHGGTQDFCTRDTSYPVPAELVPVGAGEMPFRTPGARWAEVDEAALADAMCRAIDHPGEARAKAQRGRMIIETDYSPTALTARYRARLIELGLVEQTTPQRRGVDEMFA